MSVARTGQVKKETFQELHTIRGEQNVKWKAGLKTLVGLALLFAAQSRLGSYALQEAFVVILGTAIVLLLVWLTLVAFLLLWQGASLTFRLIRLVARMTSFRDRPLALNRR